MVAFTGELVGDRRDGSLMEGAVALWGVLDLSGLQDYLTDQHQERGDALTNLPNPARWFPKGDAASVATNGS